MEDPKTKYSRFDEYMDTKSGQEKRRMRRHSKSSRIIQLGNGPAYACVLRSHADLPDTYFLGKDGSPEGHAGKVSLDIYFTPAETSGSEPGRGAMHIDIYAKDPKYRGNLDRYEEDSEEFDADDAKKSLREMINVLDEGIKMIDDKVAALRKFDDEYDKWCQDNPPKPTDGGGHGESDGGDPS